MAEYRLHCFAQSGNSYKAALALNLEESSVGVIVLGDYLQISEGDEVRSLGRLLSVPVGDAAHGTRSYDDYEKPAVCASCHVAISRQWEQAMMSQSYTHHWDEIEYFELAVPHAEKEPKVAEVKAGCNGCHAPLAFAASSMGWLAAAM